MNDAKLPYCPACGVRKDFHSPNQERICAKEIAEHPSLATLHVEIDDCSMTGKPSSKSGFYTVTMQTDPGRIVKLRLGDDALKALRDVLAVGGDCESLEIAEQPKDAVYQDGVCRDHAPWKRCKACEDIPRISSDFPADLRPTEQAQDDATEHLREIVDTYESSQRWSSPWYQDRLHELMGAARIWLNEKP